MMGNRLVAGLFSAFVLLAGCASGGGGGLSDPSQIRRDIGRATYPDVRAGVEKILVTKNAFVIQRFEENYNSVFFETEWQTSEALETERSQGIVQVRTHIVIEGRRSANDTFRLRFTASCESLEDGSREWKRLPVSEERQDEIGAMLADLDMELRSGVRTIG
jgi:hypothetical protein